jgi:hypothetical protein
MALAIVVSMVACHSALGQGGPPLRTDDPGTPGNGKWEIDTAFTLEQTSEVQALETPVLDINYGLGDHTQLKYEVAYLVLDDDIHGQQTGVGPSLAGVKWRFLDEDRSGLAMSVYPQVLLNSLGTVHQEPAGNGTNVLLPLEVGKIIGRLQLAVEAGYEFVQHGDDQWILGVAVAYPLSSRIQLLGEIHSTMDQDLGQIDPLFNVGTRWELVKGCALQAAVGHSFHNSPDSIRLLVYTGLQFTF